MIVIDLISDNPANKFAPHQRMANAIVAHTRQHGVSTPQDMFGLGFTQQEVTEQWHMAYAMAEVELKLLDDTPWPSPTGRRIV